MHTLKPKNKGILLEGKNHRKFEIVIFMYSNFSRSYPGINTEYNVRRKSETC